jgi:hypothetical protein
MRSFASKVALLGSNEQPIRHVPGELAKAMVKAGSATVQSRNGRVRSIRLIECAATHLHRIGEPSDSRATGVRFTRREMLDESGARVWAHHPRATNYE